jgi:general secretion pathway protein K
MKSYTKQYLGKGKQSGVAVITAVLVLALAATAAISISANYQLNMRRTENAFNSGQAWAYAKGAEEWAMAILARDQKDSPGYDGFDEAWWNNDEPLVFPLPGGLIEGKLEDAQGKLNVNLLKQGSTLNAGMKVRFERLFAKLDISPGLVCAIIDWIDSDLDPECSEGAEADIYSSLDAPYLPADQPMSDISELRLVHGITEEMYFKLLPHITALSDVNTPLNVNTASAEVLETLGPNIPSGVGQELVEEREEKPFKQPQDLVNNLNQRGLTADINNSPIAMGSNYFLLNTKCVIGNSQVKMVSMIHRGGGNNLTVVKRSQNL